jgi:hypothetical protein
VAEEYLHIRQGLESEGPDGGGPKADQQSPAWVGPFTAHKVQFVAFHSHDLRRTESFFTLWRLYASGDEWVPCFAEGQAALFGWAGPPGQRRRAAFAGLELNFARLAFGPDCSPAPPKGARPVRERPWYEQFYQAAPPVPPEAGSAELHFLRYQVSQGRYAQRNRFDWERVLLAPLVGQAAGPGPFALNNLPLALVNSTHWQALHDAPPRPAGARWRKGEQAILKLAEPFLRAQDHGPPASLYLAVRAARQALAKAPDEPRPYLVLAQAYARLKSETKEGASVRDVFLTRRGIETLDRVPEASLVRQTQIAYALQEALKAGPAPEAAQRAHGLLANLYSEGPYFDLHARHFQEYVKLCKSLRRVPEALPDKDKQAEAFEGLEKRAQALLAELEDRKNRYELNSAGKQAVARAGVALREGLGGEALEVLLKAPAEELQVAGPRGERLGALRLLTLLLATGRLSEVHQALAPDESAPAGFNRANFGPFPELRLPAYEWFTVQYAAGVGDYELADKVLRELLAKAKRSPRPYATLVAAGVVSDKQARDAYTAPREGTVGDLAALGLGSHLLDMAPRASRTPHLAVHLFFRPVALNLTLREVENMIGDELALHTLRAWLALEAGNLGRAREAVADAGRLSRIDDGKKTSTILVTRSWRLLQLCRELLDRGDRAGVKK